MALNSHFVSILVLAVVMGSGYENSDTPKLTGSYAVSGSGEFLFCGAKRGLSDRRYVIVPLKEGSHKPYVLSFPGTDKCFGATWRPGARPDELLFVTGVDSHDIKRFRVSSTGVDEVSSYAVDPNMRVVLPFDCWSPSGTALALKIVQFGGDRASVELLAFSKDNGKTVSISESPWPDCLLWTDDTTFYMTRVIDAYEKTESATKVDGMVATVYRMTLSKGELNVDNMKVVTRKLSEGNDIYLARGNFHGSLLYRKGDTIFCDDKLLAVMPEKIDRVFADGNYVAVVSEDGLTLFVLDATGKIISRTKTREKSVCIGISAATKSVYLTALSAEDRVRVYAYDLFGKSAEVVFEAGSAFDKRGN